MSYGTISIQCFIPTSSRTKRTLKSPSAKRFLSSHWQKLDDALRARGLHNKQLALKKKKKKNLTIESIHFCCFYVCLFASKWSCQRGYRWTARTYRKEKKMWEACSLHLPTIWTTEWRKNHLVSLSGASESQVNFLAVNFQSGLTVASHQLIDKVSRFYFYVLNTLFTSYIL